MTVVTQQLARVVGQHRPPQVGSPSAVSPMLLPLRRWGVDQVLWTPGQAGNFAGFPDVNLFDSNTAHVEQSMPHAVNSGSSTEHSSERSFFGTKSIKAVASGVNSFGPSTKGGLDAVPVTPGTTYSAIAHVYPETNPNDALWRAQFQWYDSNGDTLSFDSIYTPCPAGEWTKVSHTAVAPANAAYGRLSTYSSSDIVEGMVVFFDARSRSGSWQNIWSGLYTTNGPYSGIEMNLDQSGRVHSFLRTPDSITSRAYPISAVDGEFHTVASERDTHLRLWQDDGAVDSKEDLTSGPLYDDGVSSAYVGTRRSTDLPFKGQMAWIAVMTRTLTDANRADIAAWDGTVANEPAWLRSDPDLALYLNADDPETALAYDVGEVVSLRHPRNAKTPTTAKVVR